MNLRKTVELPATDATCILTLGELQELYRRLAAMERVRRLVPLQIRMMCARVPGRLGHARWLARELDAVKAVRGAR